MKVMNLLNAILKVDSLCEDNPSADLILHSNYNSVNLQNLTILANKYIHINSYFLCYIHNIALLALQTQLVAR